MKNKELKELWGETLYSAFSGYINEDGWLTCDWGNILEDNFSDWDKNYNDTNEKSTLYGRMYNLEYEESEDGTMIRPTISPMS